MFDTESKTLQRRDEFIFISNFSISKYVSFKKSYVSEATVKGLNNDKCRYSCHHGDSCTYCNDCLIKDRNDLTSN